MEQLRLNEFKAVYRALKTQIVWVDHLLLGLLVFIEKVLIKERVRWVAREAIKEYLLRHVEKPVSPVYTEKPSEGSTRLPEMRLTAPWYKDS